VANKTDMTKKYIGLRTSVFAVASCLALSGIPHAAHAAGLGKIVVLSALGQPLRAEIEVSATREELADMKAQLASPDAFKQAGLDYATTLLSIRFSMDKRANGQSVIRLSSDKPINDPFVDILLELNWPAGRLIREYTFLLDPPEVAAKATPPVVSVAVRPAAGKAAPSAPVGPAARATSPIDDELRSKAVANVRAQLQKPAEQLAAPSAQRTESREVKRGDTLNKIANETKPQGVSLEQMLVGLLRANQDAFDGGNMNRLKAGKILTIPDKSALEAVPADEARKIVLTQSSDWSAYRNKLAGIAAQTPVKDAAARQEAAGKITAKVEDKAAPAAEPKDQLKVSASESGAKASSAKRSEEDQIAKEKALAEANERLRALEKNVADLQKLVELKNQSLAELQKQSTAKPVPAVPAPVAAKPEAVAAASEPAGQPVAAKPDDVKPEVTPVAPPPVVEAPKPVAPKTVVPPPPPAPEPGLVDQLLDNPMALAGGGGIVALLAALLVIRRRRASQGEVPLELSSGAAQSFSGLTANSVFRSTGGQSVDTSHGPAQTDFSQAGPGSIDTDEVDPVAEADVYMAYGRDVQAEEILVEARQKDPTRYAIHLKLLEIYSNRKDLQQFETLATDLYGETNGVGADWEKAAAMGLKLDPGNPLYGASAPAALPSAQAPAVAVPSFASPVVEAPAAAILPAAEPFDPDATMVVAPPEMEPAFVVPDELPPVALPSPEPVNATPAPVSELATLDFDLGLDDGAATAEQSLATIDETPSLSGSTSVLDFDLASEQPAALTSTVVAAQPAQATAADLDFPALPAAEAAPQEAAHPLADLDFDLGAETSAQETTEFAPLTTASSGDVVDFSPSEDLAAKVDGISLTESAFLGQSVPESSSFDLSAIDLDLKEPVVEIPALTPSAVSAPEALDSEFETAQASTAVNPNFETEQAETLISARPAVEPEAAPEAAVQSETLVDPNFGESPESEFSKFPEIVASEEVATKLDLANAYEEMGDFEGARELLQEVLNEGDATQREKAQAILTKIGK
jgi:pilus assembly protein FimV